VDIKSKVIRYLGLETREDKNEIVKVREWAYTYWVHVRGQRPTLLSKKLVDRHAYLKRGIVSPGFYLVIDTKTNKQYAVYDLPYSFNWKIVETNQKIVPGMSWHQIKKDNSITHQVIGKKKYDSLRDLIILAAKQAYDPREQQAA